MKVARDVTATVNIQDYSMLDKDLVIVGDGFGDHRLVPMCVGDGARPIGRSRGNTSWLHRIYVSNLTMETGGGFGTPGLRVRMSANVIHTLEYMMR